MSGIVFEELPDDLDEAGLIGLRLKELIRDARSTSELRCI